METTEAAGLEKDLEYAKLQERGRVLTRQILEAEKNGHLFLVDALLKEKATLSKEMGKLIEKNYE